MPLLVLVTLIVFLELKNFGNIHLSLVLGFIMLCLLALNFFNSWHINFLVIESWRLILFFIIIISFFGVFLSLKDYRFEVVCLNILVLLGSLVVLFCDNLIILYLGLELQTFSMFILISKNRVLIKGAEAGLKYFILGALSSGLLLLGVTFLFINSIPLSMKEINVVGDFNLLSSNIAILLIILSLLFKLAIFPLHFWIPDIYEGSSWEVVCLLSTIPKISIISVILQILGFSNFFIICSIFSIIIGTIGAVNQTKLRRLLAYSGITHMGFILLSLSIIGIKTYEAGFIYLVIYILSLLGVFFVIYSSFPSNVDYIIELGGLNISNKILALTWGVLFLSIAGIPPLSGFISKWLVLLSVIEYKYIFCSVVAVMLSAIAAAYYLRIVKIIFFQKRASYMNWVYIMKPKNTSIMIRDYFLGFILYFSLFLILNPSFIVFSSYSGLSNLF